jgi:hypothetical protein
MFQADQALPSDVTRMVDEIAEHSRRTASVTFAVAAKAPHPAVVNDLRRF